MAQKLIFIKTFFLIFNTSQAQEGAFISPTQEDLMSVNLQSLDYSLEMTKGTQRDCNENEPKYPGIKTKFFCFCDLDYKGKLNTEGMKVSDKVKRAYPFFGELKSIEYKFTNGNDNFLNGVLQLSPNLQKFDGDDRGRTFGIENQLKVFGNEGDVTFSANSYGLSRFIEKNGLKRNYQYQRYLNYLEVNTLSVRLDSIYNKTDTAPLKATDYSIATISYEQSTENGRFSKELQRWWHHQFKNFIQYDYQVVSEDTNTLKVMGGVGREWSGSLEYWKCTTKAEFLLGMSQTTSPSKKATTNGEVSAYGGLNLSHAKVPWMALNVWLQTSKGYEGISKDAGVEVSFPIKKVNYTLKPFIGIQRHSNDRDKRYGKTSENYHVFGVMIQY